MPFGDACRRSKNGSTDSIVIRGNTVDDSKNTNVYRRKNRTNASVCMLYVCCMYAWDRVWAVFLELGARGYRYMHMSCMYVMYVTLTLTRPNERKQISPISAQSG